MCDFHGSFGLAVVAIVRAGEIPAWWEGSQKGLLLLGWLRAPGRGYFPGEKEYLED